MEGYLTRPLEFVVETVFFLYILAVMLRFLLQWVRADFFNPISQFLVSITQPLLKPLRRVVPGVAGIDLSSVVLMVLLQMVLLSLIMLIKYGTVALGPVVLRTPVELIEFVSRMDPYTGQQLEQETRRFQPRIVLNQVRSLGDIRIGYLMQNACMKYFGVKVEFLGYIENDDQVWQSIRQRQPVTLNGEYSKIAQSFHTISQNLIHGLQLKPE